MKKILITFLLTASALSAQLKTNFEVVQNGIESSVDKLVSEINKNDEYSLEINSPNEYSSLTASIKNAFSQKINIQSSSPEKINFTVNEIHLNYNDCFRDGLFGARKLPFLAPAKGQPHPSDFRLRAYLLL